MRDRRVHLVSIGAGIGLSVLLAGCGGTTPNATGPPSEAGSTSSTSGAAARTTTGTGTVTSGPSSSAPPTSERSSRESSTAAGGGGAGDCTAADIRVTLGKGDVAAGSYYAPLRFTNTGASPCVIAGYPGVSYVAGEDGHQVGAPAERVPQQWQPVILAPGEVAHATVRFLRVRNYEEAKCGLTSVRALRVYVPGETESTLVPYSGTGCSRTAMDGPQLMVKPVQPGPGGRGG